MTLDDLQRLAEQATPEPWTADYIAAANPHLVAALIEVARKARDSDLCSPKCTVVGCRQAALGNALAALDRTLEEGST